MYMMTEASSTNLFDATKDAIAKLERRRLEIVAKRRAALLTEWIARTGDEDRFSDDATADEIEDGLRDFHATVAEDIAQQRAERSGRGV